MLRSSLMLSLSLSSMSIASRLPTLPFAFSFFFLVLGLTPWLPSQSFHHFAVPKQSHYNLSLSSLLLVEGEIKKLDHYRRRYCCFCCRFFHHHFLLFLKKSTNCKLTIFVCSCTLFFVPLRESPIIDFFMLFLVALLGPSHWLRGLAPRVRASPIVSPVATNLISSLGHPFWVTTNEQSLLVNILCCNESTCVRLYPSCQKNVVRLCSWYTRQQTWSWLCKVLHHQVQLVESVLNLFNTIVQSFFDHTMQ